MFMKGDHMFNPKQNYKPFQSIDKIEQADKMADFVEERKIKKFFRRIAPILVVEILAIIILIGYLIFGLPKSYCEISCPKGAVVYVNDKKANKFRLHEPKKENLFYYYEVDVSLFINGEGQYKVTFTLEINKYKVIAQTEATLHEGVYHLTVEGGVKTTILTDLIIKSDSLIRNYRVKLNINYEKL